MKKYLFIISFVAIIIIAWQMGEPGLPPPAVINLSNFKVSGDVKGAISDKMSPVSQLLTQKQNIGKGSIVTGVASDLGSGVASVVIQMQRVKDGAVWDNNSWQSTLGSFQNAQYKSGRFNFKIPIELLQGEQYIIRSQAIDNYGNAQTKWSEVIVNGKDISPDTDFR